MKAALAIYVWAIQHDCNLPYHVPVSNLLIRVTDASHPHTETFWLQRKSLQLGSIFDHENPQSHLVQLQRYFSLLTCIQCPSKLPAFLLFLMLCYCYSTPQGILL